MTDLEALKKKYAMLTGWGYQAEVLALIDELTEVRRKLEHIDGDHAIAMHDGMVAARAAMAEEAAQLSERVDACAMNHRWLPPAIRALSAAPPSVRCVPTETLERVARFIEDDTCRHDFEKREVLAALAELVKP